MGKRLPSIRKTFDIIEVKRKLQNVIHFKDAHLRSWTLPYHDPWYGKACQARRASANLAHYHERIQGAFSTDILITPFSMLEV
jgi:hypothetical protein